MQSILNIEVFHFGKRNSVTVAYHEAELRGRLAVGFSFQNAADKFNEKDGIRFAAERVLTRPIYVACKPTRRGLGGILAWLATSASIYDKIVQVPSWFRQAGVYLEMKVYA